ncbi:NAD-dependent epimerase/dehydratase family protein [Tenggerimyces flavus]|uniref:NAD-dependent epimerase/dehydratase family protein n=1 Tax=Tenggerimyces flavus TaxID=1708749 RepID=A0ABV7YNK2_9ACTN|nr:NAD(P)-dependent oxidoreductase [Tenggerimyces flavus]MBM7789629.1 NAD+ dependent glucose-6-phosphate dehydrogenase [Tenggerimyces flavus]
MPEPRELVAITGANGLIGQILCAGLAGSFDLRPVTRRERVPGGEVAALDDLPGLRAAFQGCRSVVHLAAAASTEAEWPEVLTANIVGTRNVYEAALDAGVNRVVFASSNHTVGGYEIAHAPGIYELDATAVIREQDDVRPDSLYGASKVFGEALGRYYHDAFGLSVVCLRIGSVRSDDDPYGETVRQSAGWLPLDDRQRLARSRATWLSHRDCVELFRCALVSDVGWVVCFGTSANPRLLWSLDRARDELHFVPADRASPRLPSPVRGIDNAHRQQ